MRGQSEIYSNIEEQGGVQSSSVSNKKRLGSFSKVCMYIFEVGPDWKYEMDMLLLSALLG